MGEGIGMKKTLFRILEYKNIQKVINAIKENKRIVLYIIVSTISIDIFFIKTSSDFVTFGTLLLYGISAKIYHFRSKLTFLLCLGLLATMYVSFLFSGPTIPTEKAAVWLFLFLIVGIYQGWRE